jgi:DNA-binding response OmpR family regulator
VLERIVFALGDSSGPPFAIEPHVPGRRGSGGRLRVLIVDDERLIADTLTAILNAHDFEAVGVYNGEQAMEAARTMQPDVVLSDVLMPKMSGIDLGIKLRGEFPETSIFLFSGQAATAELLHKAHADGHRFELLPKPIHPEHLMARLRGL